MAITMAPFYNVQGSVGSGGTNSRSDVMLVQYMLWHICIQTRPNWDRNYVWTPFDPDGVHGPRAIFPCDGKYTSDLDKWIRCFQQTANERGMGPLTVDGRVNRAPVGWGKPSKLGPGKWYTLQAMNRLMYAMNADSFARLPQLDDVPPELKNDLRFQMPFYDAPGG